MKAWVAVVLVIFISLGGCVLLLTAVINNTPGDNRSRSDVSGPYARDIELYVNPIVPSNIDFRERAAQAAKDCPSGDKTCHIHEVYRYVVENYKYFADPKDQIVQAPNATVAVGGGDCEDLTILLNTLLENLGIETYVVLTDTHAYSLACDVDPARLSTYAKEALLAQTAKD